MVTPDSPARTPRQNVGTDPSQSPEKETVPIQIQSLPQYAALIVH